MLVLLRDEMKQWPCHGSRRRRRNGGAERGELARIAKSAHAQTRKPEANRGWEKPKRRARINEREHRDVAVWLEHRTQRIHELARRSLVDGEHDGDARRPALAQAREARRDRHPDVLARRDLDDLEA